MKNSSIFRLNKLKKEWKRHRIKTNASESEYHTKEKYKPSFPKKRYLATASISGPFNILSRCSCTVSHLSIFVSVPRYDIPSVEGTLASDQTTS